MDSKVPFLDDVYNLHQEKAKAYGDSWKRRGEMLGILANIARKLDRFGRPDIESENATDTAVDLLVYLAMYRWWMTDRWAPSPVPVDPTWATPYADNIVEPTAALLSRLDEILPVQPLDLGIIEERLTRMFDELEAMVMNDSQGREYLVDTMVIDAFILARARYLA